jgi:hypothetical protein
MAVESFLAGARAAGDLQALINERTGRVLASAVEVAETSESRRKGLLGRDSLDPSAALIIAPCWSIHTFFMRFVIDAVFVDRSGGVLKIVHNLKPWRIAVAPRAYAVVELNGGAARRSGVEVGDRVVLRPSTLRV